MSIYIFCPFLNRIGFSYWVVCCCCSVAKLCPTLYKSMNCSTQASLSFIISLSWLVAYIICKYFLLVHMLSFCFVYGFLCCVKYLWSFIVHLESGRVSPPTLLFSSKLFLLLNPERWCCESAALNMPANLENSTVATGLEKVSFHSNPKETQCQRMLKLPHNCTHLTR